MASKLPDDWDLLKGFLGHQSPDEPAIARVKIPGGDPPMPPADYYTKAETDSKLDAIGARFELALERVGSKMAVQMDAMEARLDARIDGLVEKHLTPIKLDHAGLKNDMDWIRGLMISVLAGVIGLLILGGVSMVIQGR